MAQERTAQDTVDEWKGLGRDLADVVGWLRARGVDLHDLANRADELPVFSQLPEPEAEAPATERERFRSWAAGRGIGVPSGADGEFEGGAGIGVPKFRDKPWDQKAKAKPFEFYTDEDVIEPTRWRSPERVGALQRDLVEAGVLEGDFQYGMFDDATADAYKALLTFANASELSKGKALGEFRKAQKWAESQGVPWNFGGEGASRKRFVAADPVEVRTDLRSVFRQQLGRDPKASELAELEGAFSRFEQQSFTQQADPAQGGGTTSDRVLQQIREGRDFIDADADDLAPVQAINPMARVLAAFGPGGEFEPEMDVAEQVEEGETVRRSLAGTAQILGGAE